MSTEEVTAASRHRAAEGLASAAQERVSCCYAVRDKLWVQDPDGALCEVYTVLADVPADDRALQGCCTTPDRADITEAGAIATCC